MAAKRAGIWWHLPIRRGLATNAIANYAGQVTTLGVGILLTPILIGRLGNSLYGVWALVVAVQGLGGLIDFGVTASVVKYVAAHHARGETAEINRVVSSSFALHLALGVLAFGVTAGLAFGGLPLLQLSPDQRAEAAPALLVAGASLMIGLPLGVLGSVLTALRQYERSNAVTIGQTLLTAGASVLAVLAGGGPLALVAINGIGLAAAQGIRAALAWRLLPGLRLAPGDVSRATLRRIGSYSIWLFVLDAAQRIFYNADAVLLAAFLPISAITAYNLGFKPANAISYLSGPFVSVLLPAAAQLDARRASADLARLLGAGTRLALGVTVPAAIWLACFGSQALQAWVGAGHEDALPVLIVFVVVFLVGAAQNPAGTILRGIGQVRALAGVVLVEYVANGLLSLWLIPRVGVVGAALGTLIPALANDLVVIPAIACRALGVPYWQFVRQSLAGPLAAGVPVLVLLWPLSRWLAGPALLTLALGGGVAALAYGVTYWGLVANVEEKRLLGERMQRLFRRGRSEEDQHPYATTIDHRDPDPQPVRPLASDPGQPAAPNGGPRGV